MTDRSFWRNPISAWKPPGEDWEPGYPLFPPMSHAGTQALFNFRDDPEQLQLSCRCSDAAQWPTPQVYNMLDRVNFWGGHG